MKLSTLATVTGGRLFGADADISRVSTDSRSLMPGDCFFALKGESFDGHDFLQAAIDKKAGVLIVDRLPSLSPLLPIVQVEDTRKALQDLARHYRAQAHIPVLGITGSCGKTSTRALLESILKQVGKTLASQKSFNNDIGLPLTVLQLHSDHAFMVLEMGTNHPGEIAALTDIAQPTVSVITMIAPVHVEGFSAGLSEKQLEKTDYLAAVCQKIAEEKAQIYAKLPQSGIAVINTDDAHAAYFKKIAASCRTVTFGVHSKAEVMAKNIVASESGQISFQLCIEAHSPVLIALPLIGEHNVVNALAAASMACALNISLEKIKCGLESAQAEFGRLNIKKGFAGATVIDDSYNANPTSVEAAIKLLVQRTTHSILVLGDMKELGDISAESHRAMGECALKYGVKQLFCYGEQASLSAQAFGSRAHAFDDQQKLIAALRASLSPDVTVLVKGSKSMKMVNVVNAITQL